MKNEYKENKNELKNGKYFKRESKESSFLNASIIATQTLFFIISIFFSFLISKINIKLHKFDSSY